ncbi:MAG TPA: sigma-70 family RNA polymerase sigma factor [Nitriliruptorales bacterium]|nr:sigma-70 family RNA polymerase sigma factor [Nitriliruptorales bacterium]
MTSPRRSWAAASDQEILAAYLDGTDREGAFGALVDRYERRVYGICYRYFGNHADAEDAAQDTFVAVARRAATFTGGSAFSTWLYRVTVNACNDLARKRARRPQTPVADIVGVVDRSSAGDPSLPQDEAVTAHELGREVQRALGELDEVSRTLLILVAIEGLTYREAAAASDLPVGTVKSRVHRARARLADLLATTVGGDLSTDDRNPGGGDGIQP